MWKWLHPYAKSETQYHLLGKVQPWLAVLSFLLLSAAFIIGLAFAPKDYQQGDSYRIIFIHVPAAIWSMGVYGSMAVVALIAAVWQIRQAHLAMISMAPIGMVFAFLSLVTGAIWGKPMWGTWWVWDARLTSALVLFFLYLGVMALYSAFQDKNTGAKAAGVLSMVGVINLPIIHFSVEWWNTLHQGATITKFDKPSMATEMLIPLLLAIFGSMIFMIWLSIVRYRSALLQDERKRPWVRELAKLSN
ncbi:heme ABC transporter permease [Glaesserella parasuis]|uniref:heme ABC transporter permease n=1 Tax=Glaesserella parasuis TaxID=738 RepID=UPI0004E84104|nr:heme ABC transporter permease [Glaesserella parasuis]AIK17549.1 heme ABC transporter permease [Glaesserella parasuis]MCT8547114.1 heme ABC transporter permease [Glaesserella parasuis]MCT8551379.1 heme ABC transporter permease [Glaesserella parasuis]MCT8592075.1 heme ABC transporter permease [Glaesserella parasuis]MDE3997391.1 heme ABC transporter permease [Glaesserella parasuis]